MKNKNLYFTVSLLVLYLVLNHNGIMAIKSVMQSFDLFLNLNQFEKANYISLVLKVILAAVYLIYVLINRSKVNQIPWRVNIVNSMAAILSINIISDVIEVTFKYYQLSQTQMAKLGLVDFGSGYLEILAKNLGLLAIVIVSQFIIKKIISNKKPNIA